MNSVNFAAPDAPAPLPGPPGAWGRFSARFVRLRLTRGRMLVCATLAVIGALAYAGPLDALLGLAWLLTEGLSAPGWATQPLFTSLAGILLLSCISALLWIVTALLIPQLRGTPEWFAAFFALHAILDRYNPDLRETMTANIALLIFALIATDILLKRSGLHARPLPWLTRRRRNRVTLPMPTAEAWEALRPRPGKPYWDKGYAAIKALPGEDGILEVDVRRKAGSQTLYLRCLDERPGKGFTLATATSPGDLTGRTMASDTYRLSPAGNDRTLVEVETVEPRSLFTLLHDPMEDLDADRLESIRATLSGEPDGSLWGQLLRPA